MVLGIRLWLLSLFHEYIYCHVHCSLNIFVCYFHCLLNTFAVVVIAPSIHLLSNSLFIEYICCGGNCSFNTFDIILNVH